MQPSGLVLMTNQEYKTKTPINQQIKTPISKHFHDYIITIKIRLFLKTILLSDV